MTKDQAAKFNGSWKQVKAENMDAVSNQHRKSHRF